LSSRTRACTAERHPTSWPSHWPSPRLAKDLAAGIDPGASAGADGSDDIAVGIPCFVDFCFESPNLCL